MATPDIAPFNKYYGNGATTQFSVGFPYIDTDFVHVYIKRANSDQGEIETTDWEWVNKTTIRFPATGSSDDVLESGDVLVVQRETPAENEFTFSNQKRLFPEDVMNADDLEMQIIQEQSRDLDRAVKVGPTSDVDPEEVLKQVERVYDSIDNIDTVADNIGDVGSVADNIAKVNTVSTNIANVNSVATNIGDVNTVAGISSAVSNVSSISSDVSDVASIKADVQNVNTISTDVVVVADNATKISTVANNIVYVGNVAQNISNVNAVADNETNINAVNANKTNIDAVAGNATNINTVAGSAANINTVAGNTANINTVATNVSAVNNCSTNMSDIQAAPGAASNAAASATEARVWATGDDDDVADYEPGEHSSHTYASLAMAIANTPEDTPVISGIDAVEVIRGPRGNGIASIVKTGTSGLVDTYTITYDTGSTTTFDVTNGAQGQAGQDGAPGQDGADGYSPSATVTQSGSVTTIEITDKDGTTSESIDMTDYELKSTVQALSATDSITLADNTLYSGGEQTSLTFALPNSGTVDFVSQITFKSGSTPTAITVPQTGFVWDERSVDLNNGAFVPVANKNYTIIVWYNGFTFVGITEGV